MPPSMDRTLTPTRTDARQPRADVSSFTRPSRFAGLRVHFTAVAGTHGKSTTSAMISYALLQCGADPSFVIGGTVPQLGGGSRSGAGDAFVAEACEYDHSFHNLFPKVAVITNIEEDHLDCYSG